MAIPLGTERSSLMKYPIMEQFLIHFGEGGSAEIRHEKEKVTYGGELQSVIIKGNILILKFSWLKKSTIPVFCWTNEPESQLEYKINIGKSNIFRIDRVEHSARICLYIPRVEKVIIFFPKDTHGLPDYKRPLWIKK